MASALVVLVALPSHSIRRQESRLQAQATALHLVHQEGTRPSEPISQSLARGLRLLGFLESQLLLVQLVARVAQILEALVQSVARTWSAVPILVRRSFRSSLVE